MSAASTAPPIVPDTGTNGLLTTARTARPRGMRRKSSGLGGEPRGDTGAAALATLSPTLQSDSSAIASARDSKLPRHSKRRKAKSLFRRWLRFTLRHTWVNPLVVILSILATYYARPGISNPLHSAIFLSYPLPRPLLSSGTTPIQYGKGTKDFAFVAFYTIVFSFLREFLMQRVIRPLAIRWGIRSRAKQSRFMEQFYTALYFSVMGPFGLYVMSRTPVWYFRTKPMYEHFPHTTHEALFKAYYLLQASYWAQQGLVLLLMLEKPRKDFKELVLHHVVTLTLIWLSYRFHFTYIGIAVYITHDVSDFFLATSKVLNYLDNPYTGPYFAFFITTWIYLRHYINLRILYSITTEFSTVGPFYDAFDNSWPPSQYKGRMSQYIAFSLLAVLQAVNVFWLFLILRILYRYLKTSPLKDERSDDEDAAEEESSENGNESAAVASSASGRAEHSNGSVVATRARHAPSSLGGRGAASAPVVLLNGQAVKEETWPQRT